VARGGIDDFHLLKPKMPLWEYISTPLKKEEYHLEVSGEPAIELMKNPAALYLEGFRNINDV
jgi:hypothetical protein